MADPLERRLELLMLLRESRPLTRAEIMQRTGAYGDDPERGRATFERDKRALREVGVPIRTVIAEGDEGATRYTVETDDYDLPPLDLEPDEHLALVMATAMVDLDRRWDDVAVRKLGGRDVSAAAVRAALPALDGLPLLQTAVSQRAPARFAYRGKQREVAARALAFRTGYWYLVADEGESRKTFRVDRIEGDVEVGEPGTVPEAAGDPLEALTIDPLLLPRDDELTAVVRIHGHQGAVAARHPGVEVRSTDGDVVELAVRVLNRDAFRTWLFGLGEHAEVVEPAELRDEIVAWLEALVRGAA
ncbi:MAG: WYL domain-containing protein [Actinomycetota bacterium]